MMANAPESDRDRSPTTQKWSQLLDAHRNVLESHLSLWTSVKGLELSGSKCSNLANSCMERTQEMIRNLENLSDFIHDTNKSEPQVASAQEKTPSRRGSKGEKSKSQKRSHSFDSEGDNLSQPDLGSWKKRKLFKVDSRPSDVEALLNHFANGRKYPTRTKRPSHTMSRPDVEPLGATAEIQIPKLKPDNDNTLPDVTHAIQKNVVTEESAIHEDEDSFLAKVNKRQQEKEERRRKKEDKKRKRESNESVEFHDAKTQNQSNKKRRRKLQQENDGHSMITNNGLDASSMRRKRGNLIDRDQDKRQKIGQ